MGMGIETLEAIQQRVLWLAVRMVDHANRERPNPDGMKVGGHQASSASMVSIMTALWFDHLRAGDRVAVKPHASPVFHAIQYLLGNLEPRYLTQLRQFGGLQAYPSRTKDPDGVDFSTGSVGLGAVAPMFAAATERYVNAHFARDGGTNRFIALVGDAELDEGNVWEAIADPALEGLGNVLWVVDLNRQSLDRVIPGIRAQRLEKMFEDNGWHVTEAKYGRRLQWLFDQPGGAFVKAHIDAMPNEEYQSLFAHQGADLRQRFLAHAVPEVKQAIAGIADEELAPIIQNLGGHDLAELGAAFDRCDAVTDRPSVLFAYTIKGWGLPMAGDPANHSALLTGDQIDTLRSQFGLDLDSEWRRFDPDSPEAEAIAEVARRLTPPARSTPAAVVAVPTAAMGEIGSRPLSSQEAFGRVLVGLSHHDEVARRIVTTSPDVSVTTNLGGWINRMGVFAPEAQPDFFGDGRLLKWKEGPTGHHIELGISEMNLFMLLSQLGVAGDFFDEPLLPVGVLYDPFVCRGLDALIYAAYSGARFVVVGTPSGVTLSAEGGAHQSTITPSIGIELPGLVLAEPAYARAVDWLLCDGLARIADRTQPADSLYLRLTTRPIDQAPFAAAVDRLGEAELRRQVLAGGYRLIEGQGDGPVVHLCGSGAVLPEVVAAAAELADEGVHANVVDITSLQRLHRGWTATLRQGVRTAAADRRSMFQLEQLFPPEQRQAPIVTVHDAASHAMSWLGSVFGAPVVPLGVDSFGQSGRVTDLYGAHDLTSGAAVNAALLALGL